MYKQESQKKVSPTIAHISVGGFHRAHQARYWNTHCRDDKSTDWGILGIFIGKDSRDRTIYEEMIKNNCVYTIKETDFSSDNMKLGVNKSGLYHATIFSQ